MTDRSDNDMILGDSPSAQQVAEILPVILLKLSKSGLILYANPYFEKISGWSLEQIQGKSWFETCLPKRDRVRIDDLFSIILEGSNPSGNINPIITPTGHEIVVEWRENVIVYRDGKPDHLIATGFPITSSPLTSEIDGNGPRALLSVIDSFDIFVGVFSLEGVFLESNQAPLVSANLSRDDVIGKPFWETYFWSYSQAVMAEVQAILAAAAAGETVKRTLTARLAEDTFVELDTSFSPARDIHGNIYAIVGSGCDVTEHVQTLAALAAEKANLDRAQRLGKIGSWEFDIASGRLDWSGESFELYGLDSSKFVPTYELFFELVHPDDRLMVQNAYEASLQEQIPYEIVHRIRRSNGEIRWVESCCETAFDSDGTALRSSGTVQDITAERMLRDELIASENNLKSVLQLSPEAIILTSPEGEIRLFSRGAEGIFRCSMEDVVGRNVSILMPDRYGQDHAGYIASFNSAKATQMVRGERSSVLAKRFDGEEFPAEISVSKSNMETGGSMSVVVRDLTDRKIYEGALMDQVHRAEAANEAKSQFLATMSHEIRTPMNNVVGILSLLRASELGEEQQEMSDVAFDAARSLMSLLQGILDITKIETGVLNLDHIEYSPSDLAQKCISLHKQNADRQGIELRCSVDTAVPGLLFGDPARVEQIIQNLLSNALKFTEAGHVELKMDLRTHHDRSSHFQITVADTGIGIDPGYRSAIFDRFTQEDSSTTRRYGGTGLGLAICKELVDLMGGTISLDSTRKNGASFVVKLPVLQAGSE